jgi:hypothetical protein
MHDAVSPHISFVSHTHTHSFHLLFSRTTTEKPRVLGKTEIVKNSLDPHWVTSFTIDYELGTPVKVAVNVFDHVRKSENKPMGAAVFDIGETLGARGNTKGKKLRKGGMLYVAVRKAEGAGVFRLTMKGLKLKNVEGWVGKSDPFFELSRKVASAGALTWDNVHRSEVVKNNLNPEWKPASVALSTLNGGDLDAPILVSVFDYESKGGHVSMGSFETTVNAMLKAAQTTASLTLQRKGKAVGTIIVIQAEVSGHKAAVAPPTPQMANMSLSAPTPYTPAAARPAGSPDFIDYVSGGLELNVVVAIDFTGSNGDPRKPGTLHHLNPPGPRNDYQKAMSSIVSVLAKYDSDQKFPVFGFGAKYGGVVRHCFQCGPSEEVHGVQGVLDAYQSVFSSGLIMSGPTVFDEIIQTAAARAASSLEAAKRNGSQSYTILLILSDGAVSDPHATARVLEQVSEAPLSIVIVGVGAADFGTMRFLDDFGNQPGHRDIAQFVEFNKHSHSSVELTSETLRELPEQVVSYFQKHNIAPLAALQRSDSMVEMETQEEEIDLSLDITEDEIVVTGGGNGFVDGFNATR